MEFQRIFISVIDNFVSYINNKFADFDSQKDAIVNSSNKNAKQTEFLYKKLSEDNSIYTRVSNEFNSVYLLYPLLGKEEKYNGIGIYLDISKFALTIRIGYKNNNEEDNNIGLLRDSKYNMYMYGIKANGKDRPYVSGTILNNSMLKIARAMHIKNIILKDSASVTCYLDNSIKIEHFSIMRLIAGKGIFYQSSFPVGYFYNNDDAMKDIEYINSIVTEEDKQIINEYLSYIEKKQNKIDKGTELCNKINEIIKKVMDGFKGREINVLRYVVDVDGSYDVMMKQEGQKGGNKKKTFKKNNKKSTHKSKSKCKSKFKSKRKL